jgi:hypothetical protein
MERCKALSGRQLNLGGSKDSWPIVGSLEGSLDFSLRWP